MAENTLLEKLEGLQHKFEEISTLITDPEVIADMNRFVKLNKEYRELERIMKAQQEYKTALTHLSEAKELLENETDPEMREMAKNEVDEIEPRIPEIEENIKLLLIPSDPEDNKNAIVEIRGGTGGDEAAIFAGDLFKMYLKYCESKGWKTEITNLSEGSSGGFKEVIFTVSGENVYGGCVTRSRRIRY
jgi:peptide chain release factor 1